MILIAKEIPACSEGTKGSHALHFVAMPRARDATTGEHMLVAFAVIAAA